jgi:ADP-heptose:LPS heptosyltransferase
LQSLFDLPDEFHCLQKEIREEDATFISSQKNIHTHTELLEDFSDTAALIDEMDLVISVDTSVAHLAGALGKETWILLPYVPDYRWMLDREDSPWYPTAKLFRQSIMGEWNTVIDDISRLLKSV